MNLHDPEMKTVYLKPGEIYIARDEPTVVTTVLGSCISVAMFNGRLNIGAICHGLLPKCRDKKACDGTCFEEFRYVECSMRHILSRFFSLGVHRSEIRVKLFGGSDMFELKSPASISVGKQNIETALKVIGDEGLTLVSSDVGGPLGRKIFFHTQTGEVLLKRQKEIK
ncbi:MAG: chemotaxis protein CheD [Nitrospiraceae bacterium]|nr:chemotaxis protein CheD [Nitrospiraceae bacterium]